MKRLDYIDIAKGICILLVILGHELTWEDPLRYFIYCFHIPLFFILSGMTMKIKNETEQGLKKFFLKNVYKLLIPYLEISVVFFIV